MSYELIETSDDLGAPVSLFEFIYGDTPGEVYRYSTTLEPVTLAGRAWLPHNITHSEIVSSGSLDRAELTVTARADIEVAKLFIAAPPSQEVRLNIWRGHELTLTEGWDDFERVWCGRVLAPTWQEADVEFKCEPTSTSGKRLGLRRHYQYGCPHVLYGRACGVSQLANTLYGRVVAVNNGADLVLDITPSGALPLTSQYLGGILTVILPTGRRILRSITGATVESTGTRVRLMSVIPGIAIGERIEIARGCLHTWDDCKTFNNTPNYGGCPNMPTSDPFRTNTF